MKNRKCILLFVDWYLPGFKAGGPVQSCANMVDYLKDEFDFRIVTRNTDYTESNPYPGISPDQWIKLDSGVFVFYCSKENLKASVIKEIIEKTRFDYVYLNGLFSFWFTLLPIAFLKSKNKKVILAARGMLAPGAMSIKGFKKKSFFFISRLLGFYKGIKFQASNETEAIQIKKYFPSNKISIAPNLPKRLRVQTKLELEKRTGLLNLINIARIAPEKNLSFALEILGKVQSKVNFVFYGPVYNAEYWKKCQELISKLPPNIKAEYGGSIEPAMIREKFSTSHFMFMPTQGENFGHIIYESLMASCPVIISDKTIWNKVETKNAGWCISVSDEKRWMDVIEKCAAMDQEEYHTMQKNASATAIETLDIPSVVSSTKKLFV